MDKYLRQIWVLAFFALGSSAETFAAENMSIDCVGTEPFWELRMETGKGFFRYEERHDFTFDSKTSGDYRGMGSTAGKWIKAKLKSGKIIRIYATAAECNDSMSSAIYDDVVVVDHPNYPSPFYGCCFPIKTYEVTGVKEGDLLDVRHEPNAKSKIIDRLDPDYAGFRSPYCRDEWCHIVYKKNIKGWVNKKSIKEHKP